jgi:acyl transferase domain-containing protein/phospholipid N-methyltransferase
VISGQRESINAIITTLEAEDIKTKALKVSHAFHSPLMESMLSDFETAVRQITFLPPKIQLISNLTGELATDDITTPEYWCHHIRQPVRFATSIATLHQQGCDMFVEIGPKPALLGMGRQCLPEDVGVWLPSLRQGQDDWQQILQSLGELYVRGAAIDWAAFDRDYQRRRVTLPTYPFQRQRYWLNETHPINLPKTRRTLEHPLLGQQLYVAGSKSICFETQLNPTPYLVHQVFNTSLVSASTFLEMALAAGMAVIKNKPLILEQVEFQQVLILNESQTIQFMLTPTGNDKYSFQIFSLVKGEDEPTWTSHVLGQILLKSSKIPSFDLASLQTQCTEEIAINNDNQPDKEAFIEKVWRGQSKALAQIEFPRYLVLERSDFYLHPVLLDAGFKLLATFLPQPEHNDTYVPVSLGQFHFYHRPKEIKCWGVAIEKTENFKPIVDLHFLTSNGELIATLEELRFQKVSRDTFMTPSWQPDWLYKVEWQPQARFGLSLEPALTDISEELKTDRMSSAAQIESDSRFIEQLEALSVEYILNVFKPLEWKLNQQFSTETIIEQLGVVSQHQRLLNRLLEILMEIGQLRKIGEQWEVIRPFKNISVQSNLLEQYPKMSAEINMLARCGSQLADVLRGQCDPLQLLFPDGDLTTLSQIYQNLPGTSMMNTMVQKAVLSVVKRLPPGRGVRILEIGAGTGGTTAYLLPHLPVHQTRYVFTDISPLFTNKASEKFSDYSFVHYQVLDIERSPQNQGFGEQEYDIIVAANVLHATADLNQTLQHVGSLLAPSGMLILLEVTARHYSGDLTFGLTEGWWRFTDHQLRPAYPLLSSTQWEGLLAKTGFASAVSILPEHPLQQAMIMALSPQSSPKRAVDSVEDIGGIWLILADHQIGRQLAARFQKRGEVAIIILPAKTYQQIDEQTFKIAPSHPEDFQQLLAKVSAIPGRLRGIIHCWSLDVIASENLAKAQLDSCGSTLHLIQALNQANERPTLWLVTQGAMPVSLPNEPLPIPNIAQSPLWGLGKAIALEHPELNCVRVDLEPETQEQAAQMLFEEIDSPTPEDQIAFRHHTRYVARLVRSLDHDNLKRKSEPSLFHAEGTYLITGGLGGLGLLVARFMLEQGAKYLVLVGRRDAQPEIKNQLEQLQQQTGAKIIVSPADVSKMEQIQPILVNIEQSLPPLRGVIHAAAVLEDDLLLQQNWERFERVFAPKIQGAWNLHRLTQHKPLDFFVLFSGAATLIGGLGIANYIAANTFLDNLAYFRQAQGLSGMSINWGIWSKIGFANILKDEEVERTGLGRLLPSQGLEILAQLLLQPKPQVAVMPIQWTSFFKSGVISPFFSHFKEAQPLKSPPHLDWIKKSKDSITPKQQRDELNSHIQAQLAKVLGLNPAQPIDREKGFFEMGMDSLIAVELKNRLQTSLKCSLPSTLLFKYSTVEALVNYLATEVLDIPNSPEPKSVPTVLTEVEKLSEEALAKMIDQELGALIQGQ